jgi:hypothetical protein
MTLCQLLLSSGRRSLEELILEAVLACFEILNLEVLSKITRNCNRLHAADIRTELYKIVARMKH